MSVRTRVGAFAPLVILTLVTAAAGVAGYRTSTAAPSPAAGKTPSASALPSPTPPAFSPGPAPPVPTFAAVSLPAARHAWSHALDKLVAAGSARYSWAVYFDGEDQPLQSEDGRFDLNPLRSTFARRIDGPQGKPLVVHVRRLGSTAYLQFSQWGRWTGCWLTMTTSDVERATGLHFSLVLPLPATVLVIADASVSKTRGFWFGPPYREYQSQVSAAEALQFLGVSPQVFLKSFERLRHVMVPITVSMDTAGRMHGGGVRGYEVTQALKNAHIALGKRLMNWLPDVRAAFALTAVGGPVTVDPPPPALLLPRNATQHDTCRAGGPGA